MAALGIIAYLFLCFYYVTAVEYRLSVVPNPLEIGNPAVVELNVSPPGSKFPEETLIFKIESTLLFMCDYHKKSFSIVSPGKTQDRQVMNEKISFRLLNVVKEYHNKLIQVQTINEKLIAETKISVYSKPTLFQLDMLEPKSSRVKRVLYEGEAIRAKCTIKGQFPVEDLILRVPFERTNVGDDEILSKDPDAVYATGLLKPDDDQKEITCQAGKSVLQQKLIVHYAPRFDEELKFDENGLTKCVVSGNPLPKINIVFNETGTAQRVASVVGEDGLQLEKGVKDGVRFPVVCKATNKFPNGTINRVSKTYDVVVPSKGLKLSNTAIIGIVVAIVVLVIVVAVVIFFKKSRSSSSRSENDKEYQSVPQTKPGLGGKEHDQNAHSMNGQKSPQDQITYAQLNYSDMAGNRKPLQVTSETTTDYAEIVGVMDRGQFTKSQPANV